MYIKFEWYDWWNNKAHLLQTQIANEDCSKIGIAEMVWTLAK